MKIPLEPIPTEQIVLAKEKSPHTGVYPQPTQALLSDSIDGSLGKDTSQLEKAYPWLLGISTCLSALLCWMYVSKPVVVQEVIQKPDTQIADTAPVVDQEPLVSGENKSVSANELMPSDTGLPTSNRKKETSPTPSQTPVAVSSKNLVSAVNTSEQGPGWEKTNLKVQHILSADDGSGELEKIVLNVPVIYETRNMRWTPVKIENARNILSRLMIYERNLNNLRREGTSILNDWNQLVKETVPAATLRADSPSLPYNHDQQSISPIQPGEQSLIQVEKN